MRRHRKEREQKEGSVWRRELIPEDSVWRRELIPEDSVWRRELIPEDSVLRKDVLAFMGRSTKSPCLECPVLMVEEARRCNRYERIPDDIWEGTQACPLFDGDGG